MTEFKHLINPTNSEEKILLQQVTVIIPCFNEALSLGPMLMDLKKTLSEQRQFDWKIVVVDNNSTDDSVSIARQCQVTVVTCLTPGYGAAIQFGLQAAQTPWAVYLDGDGTYDSKDIVPLINYGQTSKLDLVIGSRLRGHIEKGAMPFFHRYLGTPGLTGLINILFQQKLSDVNSGLRCVYIPSFRKWNCSHRGMAFASEIILKAIQKGGRIGEIAIQYKKGPLLRTPHLRPLRDGFSHLVLILKCYLFRMGRRPF